MSLSRIAATPSSSVTRPIKVGSFAGADRSGASGGWLGTLSNDPLHFFVNGAGPSMTIDTDGNVGVGTTPRSAFKLTIDSGNNAAVFAASRSGRGVTGVSFSEGGVFGISSSGSGVIGESTTGDGVTGLSSGGSGVRGSSSRGFAMYADGNAGQARSMGGWVKAMAYVDNPIRNKLLGLGPVPIGRCYNAITGTSSGGCGFTATSDGITSSTVDFGFKVDDRFVVITPVTGFYTAVTPYIHSLSGNRVIVSTYRNCGSNCGDGQTSFFIVVY